MEQQLEDDEPDPSDDKTKALLSIGKTITYENYIPLWKTVLNVTALKVTNGTIRLSSIQHLAILLRQEFDSNTYPIFDRQNMLVSLYDEMIDSILHIIDRLDLSVDREKTDEDGDDGTTTTDPVFKMKPVKPKDFEILYNLVDFCQ